MQLIVLGMHRSGTSAVTRLINMMGGYIGGEGVFQIANHANPKGHWERRDVMQFNDALFASVSASWWQLSGFTAQAVPQAARETFTQKARGLILDLDAHRPWVLKDPRCCVLFPFWRPLLEVPVVVQVFRHPIQIAQSLQQREGFPLRFGLALWQRHVLDALHSSLGLPRIAIRHEDLLADPVSETRRLYDALQAEEVAGLRLPTRREITAFIDPALHRQRGGDDLARAYLSAEQQQLHAACGALDWPTLERLARQGLSAAAQAELRALEQDVQQQRHAQAAAAKAAAAQAETATAATAAVPLAAAPLTAEPAAAVPETRPAASTETPAALLARWRSAWMQADWTPLTTLEPPQIADHPQRAQLALYAAGAQMALEQPAAARTWLQQARQWCPDRARLHRALIGALSPLPASPALRGAAATTWANRLQQTWARL